MFNETTFPPRHLYAFSLNSSGASVIKCRSVFVYRIFEKCEICAINFSFAFPLRIYSKSRLTSKWSMLHTGLDVFWDNIFWSSVKFNTIVMSSTQCSVVLLYALAWSTPVKMQVNNCKLFILRIDFLKEFWGRFNFEKNLFELCTLACHFYNCQLNSSPRSRPPNLISP